MNDPAPVVLVVDDDARLREALSSLFRSVGLEVRLYPDARAALAADLPTTAACLVCDVRMPGLGGLELQDALATRSVSLPIVFMTGHGDIPMSVRAMKAGAIDFLPKPFRDQDMLDAVAAALDRARASLNHAEGTAAARRLYSSLTPREREVMAGVVRGLLNKQVAAELGIAEITVKLHRSSLMRKLNVSRLPELVRLADALNGDPA